MSTNLDQNIIINVENISRFFKYQLQFTNQKLLYILDYNKVPYKSFHSKYKKLFTKFVQIFTKYNFDTQKYVYFYIRVLNKREQDLKNDFLKMSTITKYIDWLKTIEKQESIYNNFMKSVHNIAIECLQLGFVSTKDFIKYIIQTKKISSYLLSGKISQYYFAAIPNFNKLIPKLDHFARADFNYILDNFEMYNAQIIQAYERKTNQKVNPIRFTDEQIFKLKNSKEI